MLDAVFGFVAASVATAADTDTEIVPSPLGVTVIAYDTPDGVKDAIVPPITVISV